MSAPAMEEFLSRDIRLGQVTKDVIAPTERMPSMAWWLGFLGASGLLGRRRPRRSDPVDSRSGYLRNQPSLWMGLRYYELRVLDRYRPRWYADLGDSVFAPAKMENGDQPFGGSDDDFRGDDGGYLPALAHRTSVGGLLAGAAAERQVIVGELPLPVVVGRVRRFDLLYDFIAVLVHRSCAGLCHDARQG